jgi:hypothetical protein
MFFVNFLFIVISLFWPVQPNNGICSQINTAYKTGESIRYTIYYNVFGLYMNAGKAEFATKESTWDNSPAYTFTATGKSNSKYDWIFKVRDKYESVVDKKTLLPYQFTRQINEGGYHLKQEVLFNQKANTAIADGTLYKTTDCTFDVISAIYAARNINYSNLQLNDKITLNFFLDKELYPSYFKFLGRSEITTRYGRFKVIKFAPLLLKGTMFNGGEKMILWVTDDENHIPVRIETPIIIGSIKVDLDAYENLRHPLSSLLEVVE